MSNEYLNESLRIKVERLPFRTRMQLSRIMNNPLSPEDRKRQAENYATGVGACDLETIKRFAEQYGINTMRKNR